MNIIDTEKLRRIRMDAGMTQTEAARRLGLSRGRLNRWERGKATPDLGNLYRWAKMFGLDMKEAINP